MKRMCWPVGSHGIRPAGSSDECFYCQTNLGQEHKKSCVIRQKTVVVELKIEMVIDVPEQWDKEQIEFSLNESSSCSDNHTQKVIAMMQRLDANDRCMCPFTSARYLREATQQDEEAQLFSVHDLPT